LGKSYREALDPLSEMPHILGEVSWLSDLTLTVFQTELYTHTHESSVRE
jgi:hypothetical protein